VHKQSGYDSLPGMLRRKVLWAAAALGTGGARLLGATALWGRAGSVAEKLWSRSPIGKNGPLWL